MKLLILPGASDPNHISSKKSMQLLVDEAKKRNFSDIFIATYPGHFSHSDNSELDIKSTKETMFQWLKKMENIKEDYIIYVRSFACNPFIELLFEILSDNLINLNNLKKIIVWGAGSYHFWRKVTYENISETIKYAKNKKGCIISRNIFWDVVPIENIIQKIDNNNFPIIFCTGANDEGLPNAFYEYLKLLKNKNNSNIHIHDLIENEAHSIKEYNEEYIKLIFEYYL